MNPSKFIAAQLEGLACLLDRELIFLDDVAPLFREDLEAFVVGETLTVRDERLVIPTWL